MGSVSYHFPRQKFTSRLLTIVSFICLHHTLRNAPPPLTLCYSLSPSNGRGERRFPLLLLWGRLLGWDLALSCVSILFTMCCFLSAISSCCKGNVKDEEAEFRTETVGMAELKKLVQ